MNHWFKRLTATILSLSLTLSTVGLAPALAAKSSSADQIATMADRNDFAYYTVDETTGTTNAGLTGTNPSYNSAVAGGDSDAQVEVYKTISASTENQFDIALKVVTTDNIDELNITPDAAVVLVLDSSGSMEWNVDGEDIGQWYGNYWNGYYAEGPSRMSLAQEAAETFVADFALGANGAQRWVSVVDFDTTASTTQTWVNVADETTGTANLNKVYTAINNTDAEGGTNIYAGLNNANTLLSSSAIKDIKSVYVVLLTDGAPTYYGTGSKPSGSGNSTTSTIITQTNTMAAAVRANASIYTLAFGVGSDTCYTTGSGRNEKEVTINEWLSQDVATNANMHIDASDGDTLTLGFEQIVERIAQLASAWVVTDPMGQYITLDASSISGSNNYSVKDNTITWNLKSDSPKKENGSYVYTLDYTVTLDTDAQGFAEEIYYLTNGYTELKYCFVDAIVDENGNYVFPEDENESILSTIDFKVPAVKGEYPTYTYNVEHWVQVTGDDVNGAGVVQKGDNYYTLKASETNITGSQKYDFIDASAKNYTGLNYHLNTAMSHVAGTPVALTQNGQTLYFYYDRDLTSAMVNHYYYSVDATNNGVSVTLADETNVPASRLYVGDDYEAQTANKSGYTQITAAPDSNGNYTQASTDNVVIELVAQNDDGTANVVNYYYVKTSDSRTDVTVDVEHQYITYNYVLKNGAYVYDDGTVETVTIPTVTQKYGTSATATQLNRDGFDYIGITKASGDFTKDSLSIPKLTENSAITLTYEKYNENPNPLVDVTVTHIYETVNTIVNPDGTPGTNTVSATWVEEIQDQYRVGETFEATVAPSYNGNSYTPYFSDPASMTITVSDLGDNAITIKYTRSYDDRKDANVTVYHSYTYFEELIDEETGKASWVPTIETGYLEDETQGDGYYVTQFFTATAVNGYNGKHYTMTTDVEDLTIQLNPGKNAVYISYELYGKELDHASVKVTHTYYTWTYDWDNGVYGYTVSEAQSGDSASYTGDVGERYTAEAVTDFDGHTDWVRTDTNDLTLNLRNEDQTINLVYVRKVVDTTPAGVTVNHHYTTNLTTVVNGAVDVVSSTAHVYGMVITQVDDTTLLGGMSYTAQEIADGFTPSSANVLDLVLTDGMDNVIDLYYTLSDSDLVDTTVQVNHHYTTHTTALVDGKPATSSNTNTVAETPVHGKYVGEFFTATAVPNGFAQLTDATTYTDVTLTAGGTVIDIYYETSNNYTQSATLDVTHVYTTRYETGATVEKTFHDETVNSWATVKHTFNVDTNEDLYTVTNISSDNETLNPEDYTIVLAGGTNAITIYYDRYYDDRTPTTVTVNHSYATYDAYTGETTQDGTTSGSYAVYVEDETYTADLMETFNDLDYAYDSGEKTIDIDPEDSALNVINLTYIREIDTTPETPTTPSRPNRPTTPTTPSTPDPEPEVEVEIPGEDVPLTETPETPVVDVPEVDVPLVEVPEVEVPLVEIPVEEVPLSDIPQTGDDRNLALLMTTTLLSALGLAWLAKSELDDKKKRSL